MKKITLLAILFVLFCNLSCNTNGSAPIFEKEKTPEELRMELRKQEESSPNQYLTVDAKMKDSIIKIREAGFFRDAEYAKDGSVIKGTIKNAASVAKFKDVVLTVSYYSGTETEIKNEDFIFYEYYEPNSTKEFSVYVHTPEAMKSFGITVKTATPVN